MELYGFCIFFGILFVYILNKIYISYNKIYLNIDDLLIKVYFSSFFGGKLIFLIFDLDYINFSSISDIFFGGFSLLGASIFGLISLLYYLDINKLLTKLNSFLPSSLLLLHAWGRLGCYFSNCCGGNFFGISLHYVSICFYCFMALIGLYLLYKNYLLSIFHGLFYYSFVIFLERFLFDIFRYDFIMINFYFTKYQIFSLFYLMISIIFIMLFYKKLNYKNE